MSSAGYVDYFTEPFYNLGYLFSIYGPTFLYDQAPEMFIDGLFSSSSAVWSFGVFMWEVSSFGRPIFEDSTVAQACEAIECGHRLVMFLPRLDGLQDTLIEVPGLTFHSSTVS